MLDEKEFLGPHGIRSLSRHHLDHPFVFHTGGQEYRVQYLPGESNNGMFGGNSNWRGPVWMPVNVILIRGLLNLYGFYGDDFKVAVPDRLREVHDAVRGGPGDLAPADEHLPARRRAAAGRSTAAPATFQNDPHWRDLILFYEYFHGDNGAGLGASHQTGWTGLAAPLLDLFGRLEAEDVRGRTRAAGRGAWLVREQVATEEQLASCDVTPSLSGAVPGQHAGPALGARGRAGAKGDARRHPRRELDRLAADGFDLVWFLGVWQTGEAARRVSRSNPEWLAEYRRVLPDFRETDVCGSCFAIRDYRVHEDFGGDEALARLRQRLRVAACA